MHGNVSHMGSPEDKVRAEYPDGRGVTYSRILSGNQKIESFVIHVEQLAVYKSSDVSEDLFETYVGTEAFLKKTVE